MSVQLLELCRGTKSAVDYAVKFCTLAAQSRWSDVALLVVFREGFCPALQAEMVFLDTNTSISEYITTREVHQRGWTEADTARPHPGVP